MAILQQELVSFFYKYYQKPLILRLKIVNTLQNQALIRNLKTSFRADFLNTVAPG